MSETIPARYELDEVTFRVTGGNAAIPIHAIRWIGATVGNTLGIAPHDTDAIKVGITTPRFLGERPVSQSSAHTYQEPRCRIQKPALDYLGVSSGDELVAKKHSGEIIIKVVS